MYNQKDYQHSYRLRNQIKISGQVREWKWRKYGVINADGSPFLIADYNRAYQIQGGTCKICDIHQANLERALVMDHNHETKIFRGLLCNNCNRAIGLLFENKRAIQNTLKYLGE